MASLVRRIICASKAPGPLAGVPYNQAVVFNDIVFISGVLGLNKDTNKLVDGGAAAQAKKALQNIGYILEASGSTYENVIKNTILMKDLKDYGVVNEVYRQFFKKDFPARSCFQVASLPLEAAVEIEVIAAVGNVKTAYSKL